MTDTLTPEKLEELKALALASIQNPSAEVIFALISQAEAREGEIARLRALVEYALSVQVGVMTAHDLKQNGWQWPENAPQTVTVFSERLRRALAREGDVS